MINIFKRNKKVLNEDAIQLAKAIQETPGERNLIKKDLLIDEFVRILKAKDRRFDEGRFREICMSGDRGHSTRRRSWAAFPG